MSEEKEYTINSAVDELEFNNVKEVVFTFDGSGDSGDMSFDHVKFKTKTKKNKELDQRLIDFIENLAWTKLNDRYGGWEIDDGAYGDITLCLEDLSFHVEMNTRVTSTDYSEQKIKLMEEQEANDVTEEAS